jgi:hypothetical protein
MAKTKATVKNLKSVQAAVTKLFRTTIERESFLVRIRDFTVLRIQAETKKVNDLSTESKIKATRDGWARFKNSIARGKIDVRPQKSEFVKGSPGKPSNLSVTGQLLDSLRGKMTARNSQIEVAPTGNRTKTEFKTGKRNSKWFSLGAHIRSNQELATDLKKRGYTFLGLDQKGVQRIRRMVLDEFRRSLRSKG